MKRPLLIAGVIALFIGGAMYWKKKKDEKIAVSTTTAQKAGEEQRNYVSYSSNVASMMAQREREARTLSQAAITVPID